MSGSPATQVISSNSATLTNCTSDQHHHQQQQQQQQQLLLLRQQQQEQQQQHVSVCTNLMLEGETFKQQSPAQTFKKVFVKNEQSPNFYTTAKKRYQQQKNEKSRIYQTSAIKNKDSNTNQQQQQTNNQLQYQEQFNKIRERLFRMLSKVPIHVETISSQLPPIPLSPVSLPQIAHPSPEGQSTSTSTAAAKQNQTHKQHKRCDREPLLIKYYNDRSLIDILEHHFRCSLLKHNLRFALDEHNNGEINSLPNNLSTSAIFEEQLNCTDIHTGATYNHQLVKMHNSMRNQQEDCTGVNNRQYNDNEAEKAYCGGWQSASQLATNESFNWHSQSGSIQLGYNQMPTLTSTTTTNTNTTTTPGGGGGGGAASIIIAKVSDKHNQRRSLPPAALTILKAAADKCDNTTTSRQQTIIRHVANSKRQKLLVTNGHDSSTQLTPSLNDRNVSKTSQIPNRSHRLAINSSSPSSSNTTNSSSQSSVCFQETHLNSSFKPDEAVITSGSKTQISYHHNPIVSPSEYGQNNNSYGSVCEQFSNIPMGSQQAAATFLVSSDGQQHYPSEQSASERHHSIYASSVNCHTYQQIEPSTQMGADCTGLVSPFEPTTLEPSTVNGDSRLLYHATNTEQQQQQQQQHYQHQHQQNLLNGPVAHYGYHHLHLPLQQQQQQQQNGEYMQLLQPNLLNSGLIEPGDVWNGQAQICEQSSGGQHVTTGDLQPSQHQHHLNHQMIEQRQQQQQHIQQREPGCYATIGDRLPSEFYGDQQGPQQRDSTINANCLVYHATSIGQQAMVCTNGLLNNSEQQLVFSPAPLNMDQVQMMSGFNHEQTSHHHHQRQQQQQHQEQQQQQQQQSMIIQTNTSQLEH